MDGAKQDNHIGMGSGRLGDRGEVEWGVRKKAICWLLSEQWFIDKIFSKREKLLISKRCLIELERWTNIAMDIINDSILIKPNTLVGDDDEPT